jgi:hypothetical protein
MPLFLDMFQFPAIGDPMTIPTRAQQAISSAKLNVIVGL